MIVLDASVSLKWFVPGEPLAAEAAKVLDAIAEDPRPYAVPELFMNEVLAVLARLPGATRDGSVRRWHSSNHSAWHALGMVTTS